MTGKRSIRRTVRGSLCGYLGRHLWANFGEVHDPAAERRAAAWLAGEDEGHITDKMQDFIPGIVPGQAEFYHVAHDGTVARWWLTPGTFGPTSHNPSVTDHPLGAHPRPGWHDASGNPIQKDPRQ